MQADIAIITIRDDELRAVRDRFRTYRIDWPKGPSGRTYAHFAVPTRTRKNSMVALARAFEQGNDVSQLVTSDMIRDLDPQIILVVGIGGGIPHNEFTLGDVIISSRIHNFNVNASTERITSFDDKGGIHPFVSDLVSSLLLNEDWLDGWNEPGNLDMARPSSDPSWSPKLSHEDINRDINWCQKVDASLVTHFGTQAGRTRLPLFKTGSIASSNTLVKNTELISIWQHGARSILAVEMEAAGAYQAAQQIARQYPVMAIRGISDIVGLNRDERWTPYAAETAGAFACAFIKAAFVEPRENNKPSAVHSQTPLQQTQPNITPGGSSQPAQPQPHSTVPDPITISQSGSLNVFISYTPKDESFKESLKDQLAPLRRSNTIRLFHSGQALPGIDWEVEIAKLIDQAQIILPLISSDYLNSDYFYEKELGRALQRQKSGVLMIPIIIRPVDFEVTPFKELQVLPRNGLPVNRWQNRDEAWAEIAKEIRRVCNDLRKAAQQP